MLFQNGTKTLMYTVGHGLLKFKMSLITMALIMQKFLHMDEQCTVWNLLLCLTILMDILNLTEIQANFLKIFWILQGKLGMLSLKQGILAMI